MTRHTAYVDENGRNSQYVARVVKYLTGEQSGQCNLFKI